MAKVGQLFFAKVGLAEVDARDARRLEVVVDGCTARRRTRHSGQR